GPKVGWSRSGHLAAFSAAATARSTSASSAPAGGVPTRRLWTVPSWPIRYSVGHAGRIHPFLAAALTAESHGPP
ncbi:MAG: hypothetical protein ACRC33_13745, partial [Gemmataceae bacterium]